jgi:alcohol dehydrogenase class IV
MAGSPSPASSGKFPGIFPRNSPPAPGNPSWDFEDIGAWQPRADADKIAPVVAVPTTARTGSAVGRADGVLPSRSRSV